MSSGESIDPVDPETLITVTGMRQAGISWPIAVDGILHHHVDQARESGDRTSKQELAAAVIFNAMGLSGEERRDLLRKYRTSRVEDIVYPQSDN